MKTTAKWARVSTTATGAHTRKAACESRDGGRTLSVPVLVNLLENLHRVWTASFLLGIEQNVALLRDLALDHVEQNGSKGFLHVGADPDEEPVVELDAGGKHGADARARADGNTTAVQVREVRETSELDHIRVGE